MALDHKPFSLRNRESSYRLELVMKSIPGVEFKVGCKTHFKLLQVTCTDRLEWPHQLMPQQLPDPTLSAASTPEIASDVPVALHNDVDLVGSQDVPQDYSLGGLPATGPTQENLLSTSSPITNDTHGDAELRTPSHQAELDLFLRARIWRIPDHEGAGLSSIRTTDPESASESSDDFYNSDDDQPNPNLDLEIELGSDEEGLDTDSADEDPWQHGMSANDALYEEFEQEVSQIGFYFFFSLPTFDL
jgi:hypothetical protein